MRNDDEGRDVSDEDFFSTSTKLIVSVTAWHGVVQDNQSYFGGAAPPPPPPVLSRLFKAKAS